MNKERRATFYLTLTTVIWGSTFFSSKMGLDALAVRVPAGGTLLAPLYFMAVRMIVAIALLAMISPMSLRRFGRRECKDSLKVTFPAFVGIATQYWGLQGEGSPTVVAFLTNLTVVFTPIVGRLFFKERLTGNLILGSVLAAVGILILTHPAGGAFGWREGLVLLGSALFAVQIQLINIYTPGRDAGAMTLGMFFHLFWLNLLPLFFFAPGRAMLSPRFFMDALRPAAEGRWIDRWAIAWTILYLALFASVIAMWVFMRFQRDIAATRAAIIYCLEPAFAALLSWLIMHEAMGWRKIVGGGVILLSNVVCEAFKPRSATVP